MFGICLITLLLESCGAQNDLDKLNCLVHVYWNEFRNQLIVSSFHDDFPLEEVDRFLDSWEREQQKLDYSGRSCVLGAFAIRQVQFIMRGGHMTRAKWDAVMNEFQQLGLPWMTIMQSGWPIFHILAKMAANVASGHADIIGKQKETPFKGLYDECNNVKKLLRPTRADPSNHWVVQWFVAMLHSVEKHVSDAEHVASSLDRASEGMWSSLACLQKQIYFESVCPKGTFVTEAMVGHHIWGSHRKSLHGLSTRHRVCTPLQMQSTASVDGSLRVYGTWGDCLEFYMSLFHSGLITNSCTYLDIGANIGACSALWAALQMHVIAVEPLPENFKMLQAAAVLRELDNVNLRAAGLPARGSIHVREAAAVASASNEVIMYYPKDSLNTGMTILHRGRGNIDENSYNVSKMLGATIDSIVESSPVRGNVCAMKMDVEGSELGALKGAERTILGATMQAIYLEVFAGHHFRRDGHVLQLLAWLRRHSFQFYEAGYHKDSSSFSAHFLISDAKHENHVVDMARNSSNYDLLLLKN